MLSRRTKVNSRRRNTLGSVVLRVIRVIHRLFQVLPEQVPRIRSLILANSLQPAVQLWHPRWDRANKLSSSAKTANQSEARSQDFPRVTHESYNHHPDKAKIEISINISHQCPNSQILYLCLKNEKRVKLSPSKSTCHWWERVTTCRFPFLMLLTAIQLHLVRCSPTVHHCRRGSLSSLIVKSSNLPAPKCKRKSYSTMKIRKKGSSCNKEIESLFQIMSLPNAQYVRMGSFVRMLPTQIKALLETTMKTESA